MRNRRFPLRATVCGLMLAGVGQGCNILSGVGELSANGCPAPGEQECVDQSSFRVCASDGKWGILHSCGSQVCKNKKCMGECGIGQKRCSSTNTPQSCNADGQWVDATSGPCIDQTCDPVSLKCVGECAPEQIHCGGNTPEKCGADGYWEPSGVVCGNGTHCEGGICVESCIPNDLRCEGDMPQVCNENGAWEDRGPKCDPCKGCDPATAECAPNPKPDGASCIETSDKCVLSSTCQGGICTASEFLTLNCVDTGGEACGVGGCHPETGSCIPPDGTICEDGDACTASSVCQGGSCSPSSDKEWAHWDLTAPIPSPRYTWTENVVYDKLTRLMWQRKVAVAHPWEDAKKYCQCLNGENTGISCDQDKVPEYPSGWRLPTATELGSIVDYSKYNPCVDTVVFPNTHPNEYWTSSIFVGDFTTAWGVEFEVGNVNITARAIARRVRCVR